MSLTNAESPEVWNSFLDLDGDLKPWIRMPVSDTALDQNLQLIIDMACSWIQSYCNRPFAPKTYEWRFDGWSGWNGAYIMLPKYPVLEVSSVIEYWGISGPHILTESTPTSQVDGYQLVPDSGRITRVFPGNVQKPFFPGSRNIQITWTAGFNPIPPEVRIAALEMSSYWIRNTQQTSTGARAGAGAGADYDAPSTQQPMLWAGVPDRIRSLLDAYRTIGMG